MTFNHNLIRMTFNHNLIRMTFNHNLFIMTVNDFYTYIIVLNNIIKSAMESEVNYNFNFIQAINYLSLIKDSIKNLVDEINVIIITETSLIKVHRHVSLFFTRLHSLLNMIMDNIVKRIKLHVKDKINSILYNDLRVYIENITGYETTLRIITAISLLKVYRDKQQCDDNIRKSRKSLRIDNEEKIINKRPHYHN